MSSDVSFEEYTAAEQQAFIAGMRQMAWYIAAGWQYKREITSATAATKEFESMIDTFMEEMAAETASEAPAPKLDMIPRTTRVVSGTQFRNLGVCSSEVVTAPNLQSVGSLDIPFGSELIAPQLSHLGGALEGQGVLTAPLLTPRMIERARQKAQMRANRAEGDRFGDKPMPPVPQAKASSVKVPRTR